MTEKRPRCPDCKKPLVGLYTVIGKRNGQYKMKDHRRAWYCKNCDTAWRDNEVVYEKLIYVKGDGEGRPRPKGGSVRK